jgi:tyrosine-protein phosphatase SIW14
MVRMLVAVFAAVVGLSCALPAVAQNPIAQNPDALKSVHIDNFGQVNQFIYRGAQPEGRDYSDLAALGVKTVIDLEQAGQSDEEQEVTAAGMKFYRIPMSDRKTPGQGQIDQFLKLVSDSAGQPVFVHCHGGRHRTGTMVAVYRMTHDGWDVNRAYEEMKQYRFTTTFGHEPLKQFVNDYYAQLEKTKAAQPAQAAPATLP